MKSYTDLNLVIVNKLKALVDGNSKTIFVDVYNVPETKPEGFPFAFVKDVAGQGSILDTARNEREWQFEIQLWQEIGKKTPEQATVIMRTIVDKVVSMFDTDPMLLVSGVAQCMKAKVVPLEFNFEIRENPFIFARFTVACVDLVNNY